MRLTTRVAEPPVPRLGRALRRAASVDDVRSVARRRLPAACFDWLDGGAGAETTLRANAAAYETISLRPRVLVDVSKRDLSTTVCGTRVSLPVLLAPVGLAGIVYPGAELAAARAAGRAGTVFCVSSGASTRIEDIARAASGPLWFQLYLWRGDDLQERLVSRAEACGCDALVLTVDTPVSARRERDIRNGFRVPLTFSPVDRAANLLRRPRWSWRAMRHPAVGFAHLEDAGSREGPLASVMERLHDPSTTFEHVRRLRERWHRRLVVKGILDPADAVLAVDCGADAIVVSNHGGRQLDGAPASIDAVAEVAAAVAGRAEVLLDGGIRRGTDVVKAIALGAKAVLIGRPYLYGLAADGEAGVTHVLELLRTELDVALALLGQPSVASIDGTAIASRRA
jgi:isopentenyl diphosphate isomerase/L-lactate dehydrogenase-like FMN-dependent dehydrogenase